MKNQVHALLPAAHDYEKTRKTSEKVSEKTKRMHCLGFPVLFAELASTLIEKTWLHKTLGQFRHLQWCAFVACMEDIYSLTHGSQNLQQLRIQSFNGAVCRQMHRFGNYVI